MKIYQHYIDIRGGVLPNMRYYNILPSSFCDLSRLASGANTDLVPQGQIKRSTNTCTTI